MGKKGYIGNEPTNVPLTTSDLVDGIITAAKLNTSAITGQSAQTVVDAASDYLLVYDASAGQLVKMTPDSIMPVGAVVQSARAQYATRSTHTTVIPGDNTIPQNTEGDEILTVSITPKNANNKIRIRVTMPVVSSNVANNSVAAALFRDSVADAIGAGAATLDNASYWTGITFDVEETAGSTSSRTYKLRAGPTANTMYVNGNATGVFGGVMVVSLVVEEIKV